MHVEQTRGFRNLLRQVAATTACTLALFAPVMLPATAWATAATSAVRGEIQLDQPSILPGGTRILYISVSFEGIDTTPDDRRARAPLNLSLVLDRSGSMADQGKIDYLRQAAKASIDRLSGPDTLSVVEYDDQITLLWPAQRVRDLGEVKSLIERLEPRGSTNLAGGMQRGVDEARSALRGPASADGTITRVILMSDGLANTGITEPGEIARLVRAARQDGIRISAMGLGRDYDEDLMQAIAENGGGRYYYIEHPAQLARIFQEEMGTMFDTCARDVELGFTGTSAVRKAELVGYDGATGTRDVSRSLEDIFEGEKRTVLLRIEVDASTTGPLNLGTVSLKYRATSGGSGDAITQPLAVNITSDRAEVDRLKNRSVAAEAALSESDRLQKEQVRLYEQGRHAEAQRNMTAIAADLEAKNADLKDERIRRKVEAINVENRQMSAAVSSRSAQLDLLKASKQRLYAAKAGKRKGFGLQPGDRGLEVEQLQEALGKAGYYKGAIDGIYDDDVRNAVIACQKASNLTADGVAGAATMDVLGAY